MRFKDESSDLKLYVVAGTTTVLLSFDIDRKKLDGQKFLGFSVQRKDKNGVITTHNGSKHFNSLVNNPAISDNAIKSQSLVQSFFWYDYTVSPGEKYTYIISPMFGTPISHVPNFVTQINITTEPLQSGQHSVYFNYGVTGSQAYAKNPKFHNQPINSFTGQTFQDALAFLGRELYTDGLLKFIAQAKGPQHKLYCQFYEFQFPGVLDALKAALDRGADVQIVYSAKSDQLNDGKTKNGDVKLGNRSSIHNAGLDIDGVIHPRTKPNQPHNKYMIFFEGDIPKQVWTGSTNITLAGIFGQCNTGHWVNDADIAMKYFTYWKSVKNDPAMNAQGSISLQIQSDTDLTKLPNGTYTFFSPRDRPAKKGVTPQHLKNYASLIDTAQEMVCMVLPFNLDDVFKTVYQEKKNYLRFLIFEKTSEAESVDSSDPDLKITAGAILDTPVENFAEEVSAATTSNAGILYVHNKFFIIDALTDDPIVVTGSANFSANSITNNDENSLMIKGDKRVADIYLTEFNRLFIHFWPRFLQKIHPGATNIGFAKQLDETFTWYFDYFDQTKFDFKRKDQFAHMKL